MLNLVICKVTARLYKFNNTVTITAVLWCTMRGEINQEGGFQKGMEGGFTDVL
jgi:hypothetical protein